MFEKRKICQFGEWMWGSWGWAGLKFWGIGDWESGVGAVDYESLGGCGAAAIRQPVNRIFVSAIIFS